MENTNPQGSAISVSQAAVQFLGMMDGEEAQAPSLIS